MRETVEILSMDSIYRDEERQGKARMKAIIGTPYEQELAVTNPNDARACVEKPAVFKGDD